ncbi:MAG: ATP-binding protein [Actinomycetota bacterium]|nr:ATP-binding protein [Actinomycetota bacterium]
MLNSSKWRRDQIKGIALTTASFLIVTLTMFSLRSHISVATAALVLVIPVILGVVVGGFGVGLVGIVAGFIIYDFVFIPPYYTLNVGQTQNWIALGVYVAVVIIVSRVVANMKDARSVAVEREIHARQLFELSKLLLGEHESTELLDTVASSVQQTFQFEAVLLLLQGPERLEVGATAGRTMTANELHELIPETGFPATLLRNSDHDSQSLFSIALTVGGKPVGLLVMQGALAQNPDLQLLSTFANHAALAIEQAQLKQQALDAQLLTETDKWRRALLSSVSHDLRTPLASIKAAASGLNDPSVNLDDAQTRELLDTISTETDRLSRLVVNLLDMTRIEAGVMTPNNEIIEISDLIEEGLTALGDDRARAQISLPESPRDLFVSADHVLISQVIANLVDNALRHSPKGEPVAIEATPRDTEVVVTVTDHGLGVPPQLMEHVFEMFSKDSDSSHAGIGLAIAKAFVSAHGGQISVENSPSGGARFSFSLPLVHFDERRYLDDEDTSNR